MAREFYRIVRNPIPALDDFRSASALGIPRPEMHVEQWAHGVSVYDNLAYALRRASRNRTGLGRYVATLVAPEDGSVRFAKTFGPHHFTIYADPETLLVLVRGPVIAAGAPNGERGNGRLL